MPQSVLSLAQALADEIGIERPASVIGSSEDNARRYLQALRGAGNRLAQRDWRVMLLIETITTVAGITEYALSANFGRHLPGTDWDGTTLHQMTGDMTPRDWQANLYDLGTAQLWPRPWRLKVDGNRDVIFALASDPGAVYTLTLEIATGQWLENGGVFYRDPQSDSDTFVLDDWLMQLETGWRLRKALGLAYADEAREATVQADRLFANERRADVCLPTRARGPMFANNAPEYGFG
jgi:hypothetical protein